MGDFGIDPETWKRLNRLLDDALALRPEQRAAFIDALPVQDELLKTRLRALLSHAAEGTAKLGTLPKLSMDHLTETESARRDSSKAEVGEGEQIGPYRLKALLGEGGMGAVWLAERTDGMLPRPVALKLPRGAYSRPELLGRIAREREILASLTHPHIARLYDAGLTANGQPFLALELVEGSRLDEYVGSTRPGLESRLRLFLQVARAVAYAHSRLVVHRDIKPSNILVTADGSVRLLDFGVASLLSDGQVMESEITRLSGPALTLAYAAPEQIGGGPIGVGVDIYSLGVVLFELLTGTRPYRLANESRAELENAIVQQTPPRPSTVVTDESIGVDLRGDLDTIVLKTLKKDPGQRYPTVDALVEDIERYFAGRPVLARPDSAAYRLRKFVGRNRLLVSAAAVIVLAVLGGAGVAFWQARVAVAEKGRAEEVKNFIVSIFQDADPYIGPEKALTATDLLRNAEARILSGFDEGSEIRIELLTIVGTSLHRLQEYEAASPILDRAASEGIRSLGRNHPRTLHARIARTSNYRYLGKTEEMKSELEAILPELDREGIDFDDRIVGIENQTHLAIDEGRYSDAASSADRAFSMAMTAYGEAHATTVAMSRLRAVAYRFSRHEQAMEAAEYAYRRNLEHYGGNRRHPSVVDVHATYALNLLDRGRRLLGVEHLSGAVEDARELFGEESAMVGFFSGHLSKAQAELGDIPGALAAAGTHVRVLTSLAEPGSYTYASTLANHGEVLLAARRPAEAVARLDQAIPMLGEILEPSHRILVNARLHRALGVAYGGNPSFANTELDAIETFFGGEEPPRYPWLTAKGIVARLQGDFEQALDRQQAALAAVPEDGRSVLRRAPLLVEAGLARLELGDVEEAAEMLGTALELSGRESSSEGPLRADALVGLARAYLAQQSAHRALPLLEEAAAYWERIAPESRWAAEAALCLDRCLSSLGRSASSKRSPTPEARPCC